MSAATYNWTMAGVIIIIVLALACVGWLWWDAAREASTRRYELRTRARRRRNQLAHDAYAQRWEQRH